ncbi:MAG: hemolysin family protein [Egicoccus sp.]
MNGSVVPYLVAVVLLLLVTALLAAIATVIDRLNVVRALRLAEEERRGSQALLWLTEHRVTSLNVLLTLNVIVRLVLGAIAALAGWRVAEGGGAALTLLITVVVVLVLGEVTPRTVVLRHLESSGLKLAGIAVPLVRAFDPVARGAIGAGRSLVPRRHEVSGPYASDDELRQLDADEDEQDEELEPEERAMIRSIFELADTIVREIMVPRPDMVTVPEDASLHEVVRVVIEGGYSRVPVHEPDDSDTIVGVVYAKDLLRRVAMEQRRERWSDLVRQPTLVPETKRCDELLRELQEATVHLAVVVDEYGEVAGLVTIEDILEEIVGEIVDEHDHEDPLVELLDDEVLRIDARLGVDDLNELLSTELPEEGWDTVGGLVFGTLGRVPVEGETLELEGVCIEVERVQGRRVGKVLISRRAEEEDESAPSEEHAR